MKPIPYGTAQGGLAKTALAWKHGSEGTRAGYAGETMIGVIYPDGRWSSSIIGITKPAATVEAARTALEAAWTDWLARSGLTWVQS